jgi:hypothetical protein
MVVRGLGLVGGERDCGVILSSQQSVGLARAIKDLDAGTSFERPGGWRDQITNLLNIGAGVLFLAGVAAVTYFVWRNV